MKSNNSPVLRFIVGLAMIYFVWTLASAGVFHKAINLFRGNAGFSGVTDLALDILPYAVDTVMLFGTIGIAIWAFLLKAVTPLATKLLRLLDAKLEDYGIDLFEFEDEKPAPEQEVDEKPELDVLKLNDVLSDIDQSLDSLSDRIALLEGEQV